ncbi:MAG TPA: ArsC family reductase [Rhodocyclaceae bacterium]|nr:ArsC family reductase [Rhodocyclaceae bacterium]
MINIFGIKNCNTMKKAFDWLDTQRLAYHFHDYKKAGVTTEALQNWTRQVGWQKLLNTQGTTWRGLSDAERSDMDEAKAIALMVAKPSLIKRPVIDTGKKLLVGFDEANFAKNLKA